jgi:protein smg homolog
MAEVIAFLIEHFQDFDACPPPEDLGRLLEDAGFDATEIGNTLMMLEVLLNSSEFAAEPLDGQSVRVYSNEETDNLPQEVMGLMQYLVSERAITYEQREIVIHALMHIPSEEITVDTAKVLTLLVLWAHKSELPVLIGDDLMAALNGKAVMH